MSNAFKPLALVFGLLLSAQCGWSFSLLGPQEAYQVNALGYVPTGSFRNWPKNIDDEYRWNTRVLYYSYAPEFTSYFGSNGIVAIDGAFEIMNSLTNVSSYSPNLTEWPLEALSVNYTAAALQLLDLQSLTLELLVERMGLANPERFIWTLRARALPPGAQCPAYNYLVIQRNFDPISLAPSSYVNGNLYTYQILETCPNPNAATAAEFLVDPLDRFGISVASFGSGYGNFWEGLTRDDVGGLRYLLQTNNLNWETTPNNSFIRATNTSQPVLLVSSNLQVFSQQSLTNTAADLQALYPGLTVTGTSNYFVNAVETNVFAAFETDPYAPVGSPPTLVIETNYSTNVAIRYYHTFDNVLTNQASTSCRYTLLTTNIAPSPYAPPGSGFSVTNVTLQNFVRTNCASGSFFILPSNVCDYSIIQTQLIQVLTFTNFLTNTFATNVVGGTNVTSTNLTGDYYEFSQSIITYFTNYYLTAYPVTCPSQLSSLFQGIEKVTFVRRDYDSLLGQFFEPVTNNFTLTEVTNNHRVVRSLERSISAPDIIISAGDIVTGPTAWPIINPSDSVTQPNYQTASNNNQGPGTIRAPMTFTYNKVGPAFLNVGPQFITEGTAVLQFIWGSFDGSTNAPIVYPVGTDLLSLENMAVLQITEPDDLANGVFQLPPGGLGTNYNDTGFQLEAIGGQPPYTWSLAPGSGPLPEGLELTSSGLIWGAPEEEGMYDFTIRLTETGARHIDAPFFLLINP